MFRVPVLMAFVATLLISAPARGQDSKKEIELLKNEIEVLKKENEVLKREIELLKKEAGGKSSGQTGSKNEDELPKVISMGVELEVVSAKAKGKTLELTVGATNGASPNKRLNFQMFRVLTEDGKLMQARQGSVMAKPVDLPPGIPVKFTLRLDGLPSKTKKLARVQLSGPLRTIEFKDVPVER